MDLSIKLTENSTDKGTASIDTTSKRILSDDEIEANASMLKNILSMKKLDEGIIDIPDDSLLRNILYITEIRGKIDVDNDETPNERKIRKSRERCRRYRARRKEQALLGEITSITKPDKQKSVCDSNAVVLETPAERKRRFARERSKRYRQRLKDKETQVVPTQHNVILGNMVIGRVEVMETIAEKRRRQARERYRRIHDKLSTLGVSEILESMSPDGTAKLEKRKINRRTKGRRRGKMKDETNPRKRHRIESSAGHTRKRRKIKSEDYPETEDVYNSCEEFYTDLSTETKLDSSQISMQDYLHLYSLTYPPIIDIEKNL